MASHSSSLEDMLVCSQGPPDAQRKLKPPAEQSLKCPRCDSTNTKFCYYNNYSLSQPRYFCKSCRRYWTRGGTLRNVPVGGGCRKNKKPSSKRTPHLDAQFSAVPASPNPGLASGLVYDPIDLGLQFGGPQKHLDRDFPVLANLGLHNPGGTSVPGFLDTLWNGIFLETQNNSGVGFGQSVHQGLGHGGGGIMFSSYEEPVATKGEPFSGNLEGDERVLWGFPWQVNSDHEVDSNSGRAGWTGLNSSTRHGLLNNPLIN